MDGFFVFLMIIFFVVVPLISKAKKKEAERQRKEAQQGKMPPIRTDIPKPQPQPQPQPRQAQASYTPPIPYTPATPAPLSSNAANAAVAQAYIARETADEMHPHAETMGKAESAPTQAAAYAEEGCEEHYDVRPAWVNTPMSNAHVNRSAMMQAVVFAEVLAKPKALRRGRGGIGV